MSPSHERKVAVTRSIALLNELAKRLGASGYYEFAAAYDDRAGSDTQGSGKWRPYFNGDRPLTAKALQSLFKLFPGVDRFYIDGPADLWRSMWGDPGDLWSNIRTRYVGCGSDTDDQAWEMVCKCRAEKGERSADYRERSLGAAIAEYEGKLLSAIDCREPLTLRFLSEGIALYRLHWRMEELAPSEIKGEGLYRSIGLCLHAPNITRTLEVLGVLGALKDELKSWEFLRLQKVRYRRAVGLHPERHAVYLEDPFFFISSDRRWRRISRSLDWTSG